MFQKESVKCNTAEYPRKNKKNPTLEHNESILLFHLLASALSLTKKIYFRFLQASIMDLHLSIFTQE